MPNTATDPIPMDVYFDFSSPYSYLAMQRMDALLEKLDPEERIQVLKKPILLGPIFQSLGLQSSPFEVFKHRGEYMWVDVARRAKRFGIPFQKPSIFPAFSVYAARIAYALQDTEFYQPWILEAFRAVFERNESIKEESVLMACLETIQHPNPKEILETSNLGTNKNKLKDATEEARSRGVFGAPFFIVRGEGYWGDDRMEDAILWALGE